MRHLLRVLCKLTILASLFAGALVLFTVRPVPFVLSKAPLEIHADSARLARDIQRISTEIGPRDAINPNALLRTSDEILKTFRETNARVSLQTYLVQSVDFQNVISEYGFPSPAGTVVIGAHYDTVAGSPGADDNASGVAALFELGRLFAQQPPPTKVLLAAYPLEEGSFRGSNDMGSLIHAKSLYQAKEPIRLMMSLESIGFYSEQPGSQQYPWKPLSWVYPDKGDFLAVVGLPFLSRATIDIKRAFMRSTLMQVHSINVPDIMPGVGNSDHASFWRLGFDAVMVTDTATYRNPNYHTASDLPDTLDFTRLAQTVDGIFAYVSSLNRK